MQNLSTKMVLTVALLALGPVAGCSASVASQDAAWPPVAKKWFERAVASHRIADIEDAETAIENALRMLPEAPEVRRLAAEIALARLEFDRALELLEGLTDGESRAVRSRALWYSGDIERTADELDLLLADPDLRDSWATEVAKLARRGTGRKPFAMSGGLLAVTEMPPVGRAALVVPLELNGEPALGMIATQMSEAVIDAGAGAEPAWISLRFGDSVEVRDVPAFAKDLSGISRQLDVPIRVLLGTQLLRHLNLTFDLAGQQFVVRSFEPPPPPRATTVKLAYVRGSGMVVRSALAPEADAAVASLLIDTGMVYPLALDDAGWGKAGVALSALKPVPGVRDLQQGLVPYVQLGAFEVPQVPAVRGKLVAPAEESLGVDLDGILGAGMLAPFRVTLTAGGRTLWLEDMPVDMMAAETPAVEGGEPGGLEAPSLVVPSGPPPVLKSPMLPAPAVEGGGPTP